MSDYLRHNANIRDDEDILRVIRRFWLTFFWPVFFLVLFIVGPFFFIVPLFRMEVPGILIFFGALFIGAILAFRTFVSWYFNALIITTERVIDIDQRGFFERTVSEARFEKVSDVSFRRKGVLQTIFRYGSVTIQTHGSTTQLVVRGIQEPERVQEIILKSVEHVQGQRRRADNADKADGTDNRSAVSAQSATSASQDVEVEEILKALRKKVGDDVFRELVHKTESE